MTESTTETPLQVIERLKKEAAEKRSEGETKRKALEEDTQQRVRAGAERILREMVPHAILDSGILLRHEYSLAVANATSASAYLCIPHHLPIHVQAESKYNPKQVSLVVHVYDDRLAVVTSETKTEWWTATPDYGKVLLWAAEGFAALQSLMPVGGIVKSFTHAPVTEWLYHQLYGTPALQPVRLTATIDVFALNESDAVRRLSTALQKTGVVRTTAGQA